MTLRQVEGAALLQAANDTEKPLTLCVHAGYLPFDGSPAALRAEKLLLAPRSRAYVRRYPLPDADYAAGAFCVLPDESDVAPAVLRMLDARKLPTGGAAPRVLETRREGADLIVTLACDRYAHGVYLEGVARMSDNYFDLLPGQIKRVTLYGASQCPPWRCVR